MKNLFQGGKQQQPQKQIALRDAMNRLFDESVWNPFGSFFSDDFFPQFRGFSDMSTLYGNTSMDVSETDKNIEVTLDVPGYDPKDISVEIDNNVLTVSGETKQETETKEKKYYQKERSYGSFRRQVQLPANIESEKIECTAKNGTLTITIPKKIIEKASTKKLEVKVK